MVRTTRLTRSLSYSSILIATGLVLPQLFHLVGGSSAGGIFLPMHLPVFIAGLLLGPVEGLAVGLLSPTFSFLFSGMPALSLLPFMIIELAIYGLASGLLARIRRMPLVAALVGAQIAGRLAKALALWVAAHLLHFPVPGVVTVYTALLTGLPGILLQLVVVPVTVHMLRKVMMRHV